jgi:hypothetical protein
MKNYRVEQMYGCRHSLPRHWLRVSGQLQVRGRSRQYPIDRRLGGPQSQSGRYGETELLDHTGNRTPIVQPETGKSRPPHNLCLEEIFQHRPPMHAWVPHSSESPNKF